MTASPVRRPLPAPMAQLRVSDTVVTPGSSICGEVTVTTGAAPVRLDTLVLSLTTDVPSANGLLPRVLAKEPLAPHVTVAPHQSRTLPFTLALPAYTPLSLGSQRVMLRVVPELFTAESADAKPLVVRPHPLMTEVFTALEELGFWLSAVEYVPLRRPAREFPFCQRFTFRPPGRYRRRVGALQLWFALVDERLETALELAPPALRAPGVRSRHRVSRLTLPVHGARPAVAPDLFRLLMRRLRPSGTAGSCAGQLLGSGR